MKFILMLLSVYRITYMIVFETGPVAVFEKVRSYIFNKSHEYDGVLFYTKLPNIWENVDEGINCPYCVSVWVSGIVWMISRIKYINKMFLGVFGLAGAYLLLQQIMDRIESDDS